MSKSPAGAKGTVPRLVLSRHPFGIKTLRAAHAFQYPDELEPQSHDAVVWRFMNMKKFADLMDTSELYSCRADLFEDKSEGLLGQLFMKSTIW